MQVRVQNKGKRFGKVDTMETYQSRPPVPTDTTPGIAARAAPQQDQLRILRSLESVG